MDLNCSYTFPSSLPSGAYRFRVNITDATTALSNPFHVTAAPPDCTSPPPWPNVTSISAPNFRSFRITSPRAGDILRNGDGSGSVSVDWRWIDDRNRFGAGIKNMVLEFVNPKTGQSTGVHQIGDTINGPSTTIPLSETSLTPGSWTIRANYTNKFEGSPLGSPVSYLSEEFFLAGNQSECDGIGFSSSAASNFQLGRVGFILSLLTIWQTF
jgi:hypothetical protein